MLQQFLGPATIGIKDRLAYKAELYLWMLVMPVFLGVQYFLWLSIFNYSQASQLGGFTLKELITYFVITNCILVATWTNVDRFLAGRIRNGMLTIWLIRPMTFFRMRLFIRLGEFTLATIVQCLPLIIIGLVVFSMHLGPIVFIGLGLLSTLLAFFLNFAFAFFLGLSAFWLTEYGSISMLRSGITWFLSGAFIPITLFPHALQQIFNLLPFQYLTFVPAQIFLEKYSIGLAIANIFIQVVWCAVLYLLIKLVWPIAMKRYSAVGV
jgi:ABC-2 type transport system permease protein